MRLSSAIALILFTLPLTALAQHPTLNTQKADAPPAQKAAAPDTQKSETPDKSQPTQTLSVDARLVNLPVVVRDNKGALIPNLTKADFTLEVDNKPQTIRYFDIDSNLPLTLGLLVDTSESQRTAIDDERTASSAFLDQMLTGKSDQAFVVQFAHSVELLQDLTTSRPKLQAALKELDTPARSTKSSRNDDDDQSGVNVGKGSARTGGTTLYDSVFLASDELMSKQKGRKALIILTDGDDRSSKETLASAIEAAQRGDTIIYAIYFKGGRTGQQSNFPTNRGNRGGGYPGGGYPGGGYPGGGYPGGGYPGGGYPGGGYPGGGNNPTRQPPPRNDSKNVLNRMTKETGGRVFEVSKKQTIADIYTEIGKELRAQYRLGYTPTADITGDGYHQVDLYASGPDKKKYVIQTRDGYFTGK